MITANLIKKFIYQIKMAMEMPRGTEEPLTEECNPEIEDCTLPPVGAE
jgi:hypothetical protein